MTTHNSTGRVGLQQRPDGFDNGNDMDVAHDAAFRLGRLACRSGLRCRAPRGVDRHAWHEGYEWQEAHGKRDNAIATS